MCVRMCSNSICMKAGSVGILDSSRKYSMKLFILLMLYCKLS